MNALPSPSPLHPIVKLTEAKLRAAKPDKYGAVRPGAGGLGVRVSLQHLNRAISIMDALAKAFEARGHKIQSGLTESKSIVVIDAEQLGFQLTERISQRIHHPTEEEKEEKLRRLAHLSNERRIISLLVSETFARREWDFIPTNEFTISGDAYRACGQIRNWKDGPSRRLESMIPDIVSAFESYPEVIRRSRIADRERALRIEAIQRQQEAEERRRQLEQQARETLERDAAQWERAMRIRGYVAAVRGQAEKEGCSDQISRWCQWALGVADDIDPAGKAPPPTLDQ